MNIYYNITRQCRVDENNCRLAGDPVIYFGQKPEWKMHLFSGELEEMPTTADLSGIAAWRAAIDADWTMSTSPMCRTVSGIAANTGVLTVPLDANTVRFKTVLDGAASRNCHFELRGLDTNGGTVLIVQFPVTCHNVIDPDGGEPPEETPSGYATEAYVDAVVSREIYVEFSADGTSWHTSLTTGDLYERIKHGSTGEWSDPFAIPYGPQGEPGPEIAIQYSADGVSFHDTFASGDKFIRFSTDEGDTWGAAIQFVGDDGTTYDWLSGTTAPASATGKDGDWYVNTASGYVYTKVSGSWVQKLNIIGPQGPAGPGEADDISITDTGGYFTSNNVEGALQEIGAALDGVETSLEEI